MSCKFIGLSHAALSKPERLSFGYFWALRLCLTVAIVIGEWASVFPVLPVKAVFGNVLQDWFDSGHN
jgi:hypothetical protein